MRNAILKNHVKLSFQIQWPGSEWARGSRGRRAVAACDVIHDVIGDVQWDQRALYYRCTESSRERYWLQRAGEYPVTLLFTLCNHANERSQSSCRALLKIVEICVRLKILAKRLQHQTLFGQWDIFFPGEWCLICTVIAGETKFWGELRIFILGFESRNINHTAAVSFTYIFTSPIWLPWKCFTQQVDWGHPCLVPVRLSLRPSRSIDFGDVSQTTFRPGPRDPKRMTEAKYWGLRIKQHTVHELRVNEMSELKY